MSYRKEGVITSLLIYKSDGSSFLFPTLFVKTYKLNKDLFINDEVIDNYIYKYSYHYSISLLSRREHSIFELKNKLIKKNVPSFIIDKTIEKLLGENYLSNERFIESFIRSKKDKSKRELFFLLKQKGVDYKSCEEEVNKIDEISRLENIIIKKIKTNKSEEKIIKSLVSRGFNYYDIKKVYKDLV